MRLSRHDPERRHVLWALAGAALVPALPAMALGPPSGPVVLTVSGARRGSNDTQAIEFDLAMLQQLPQASYATRTPWYPQPRRFSGPLLRDVLGAAGTEGETLRLIALNDYYVDIPASDAMHYDVVVALRLDDKAMTVRDKGPLLVMYPFDAQPELRTATFYSRAAWQLRSIQVR